MVPNAFNTDCVSSETYSEKANRMPSISLSSSLASTSATPN